MTEITVDWLVDSQSGGMLLERGPAQGLHAVGTQCLLILMSHRWKVGEDLISSPTCFLSSCQSVRCCLFIHSALNEHLWYACTAVGIVNAVVTNTQSPLEISQWLSTD